MPASVRAASDSPAMTSSATSRACSAVPAEIGSSVGGASTSAVALEPAVPSGMRNAATDAAATAVAMVRRGLPAVGTKVHGSPQVAVGKKDVGPDHRTCTSTLWIGPTG